MDYGIADRFGYYDRWASGLVVSTVRNLYSVWDARFAAVGDVYHKDSPGVGVDDGVEAHARENFLVSNHADVAQGGTGSAQGTTGFAQGHKHYRKLDNIRYNREEPMTLVLNTPEIWVGGIEAAEDWDLHRDAHVKVIMTCANLTISGQENYKVSNYLRCDMNAVTEGHIKFDHFVQKLLDFDTRVERIQGSALVHCLRGANRVGIFTCAYLMAKCQVNLKTAYLHLQSLRKTVDISSREHGTWVDPQDWLLRHETEIRARFVACGRVVSQLPIVVSAQEYKGMVCCADIERRNKAWEKREAVRKKDLEYELEKKRKVDEQEQRKRDEADKKRSKREPSDEDRQREEEGEASKKTELVKDFFDGVSDLRGKEQEKGGGRGSGSSGDDGKEQEKGGGTGGSGGSGGTGNRSSGDDLRVKEQEKGGKKKKKKKKKKNQRCGHGRKRMVMRVLILCKRKIFVWPIAI